MDVGFSYCTRVTDHDRGAHARGAVDDGVGRRGDGQHEGEGAGQRRRDHEVERVQPQGVGEVLEDGEEDADGGHVGGDLGGHGGARAHDEAEDGRVEEVEDLELRPDPEGEAGDVDRLGQGEAAAQQEHQRPRQLRVNRAPVQETGRDFRLLEALKNSAVVMKIQCFIFLVPTSERPKGGNGWQHEKKDNYEHSGRGVIDGLRLLGHLRVVAVRGTVSVHELVTLLTLKRGRNSKAR